MEKNVNSNSTLNEIAKAFESLRLSIEQKVQGYRNQVQEKIDIINQAKQEIRETNKEIGEMAVMLDSVSYGLEIMADDLDTLHNDIDFDLLQVANGNDSEGDLEIYEVDDEDEEDFDEDEEEEEEDLDEEEDD